MNKSLLIGFICWSIGIALLGIAWQVQQDKQVIDAERQIAHNQGYQVGWNSSYYQTYPLAWKVGYTQGKLDGEAPYKPSTNGTISIDEALAILAEGKASHQSYIDRPWHQNKYTGDTAFNLMWADYYTDLENLIKWLAKEE